jgi:hypothetical protein
MPGSVASGTHCIFCFRTFSIVLIFKGVRRFQSLLFFRLRLKWAGAPNLVDPLEWSSLSLVQ